MTEFTQHHVMARDGGRVAWSQAGSGPAVAILHGGTLSAVHYRALGAALADRFTVLLVDRRGRGGSGPPGPADGPAGMLAAEVDDVAAVLRATGARRVFGHSGGGVIALEAARVLPIERLALYEPPVGAATALPGDWIPSFQQALAEERPARALVIQMRALGMAPPMPGWLLELGARLLLRTARGRTVAAALPWLPREHAIGTAMGDDVARYRDVRCPTLLLAGVDSAPFLRAMVARAEAALPDVRRVDLDGLNHDGPADMGAPDRVVPALRQFFAAS